MPDSLPSIPTMPPGLPAGLPFSPDARDFATDASGRIGARPFGVVRPGSGEALRTLVKWANTAGVKLVPVSSRGGPRRRGDTVCPVAALIVDLSGMNRVIHADGRDAVAVIEVGVTFDELDAALKPHGLKSFRPLLPRTSKSVLAAFLEREPITVPGHHWDSADPLATLELVFGSGDPFRTGGAALPGTTEENLARGNRPLHNTGPGQTDFGRMIQGAQGSLGIVARGSVLCHRVPAQSSPWFVSADTLAPVVATAYAMLRKRDAGHLFIVNATQLALMLATDAASFGALRAVLPAWTLFVELTAPPNFADEAMAYRETDFAGAVAKAGARQTRELGGYSAQSLADLLGRSVAGSYKDRAGSAHEEVFFLSQLDRVQGQLDAVASVASTAEMAVYLQPMAQGVSAHCEFTYFAASHDAAAAAGRAAALTLSQTRAFFSRPYHLWADLAFARDLTTEPVLKKLKLVFDPNGVLQPGSQALGDAAPYVPAFGISP